MRRSRANALIFARSAAAALKLRLATDPSTSMRNSHRSLSCAKRATSKLRVIPPGGPNVPATPVSFRHVFLMTTVPAGPHRPLDASFVLPPRTSWSGARQWRLKQWFISARAICRVRFRRYPVYPARRRRLRYASPRTPNTRQNRANAGGTLDWRPYCGLVY